MNEQIRDEASSNLAAGIEAMIPKSLDDIIRKNRELVQLRLANDSDIAKLEVEILETHPLYVLDNWNLIAFDVQGVTAVRLIGDVRNGNEPRITSHIVAIDIERQLLKTNSGNLYQMGSRNEGEPDTDQLYLICAYMHQMGIGHELGVPHFFY